MDLDIKITLSLKGCSSSYTLYLKKIYSFRTFSLYQTFPGALIMVIRLLFLFIFIFFSWSDLFEKKGLYFQIGSDSALDTNIVGKIRTQRKSAGGNNIFICWLQSFAKTTCQLSTCLKNNIWPVTWTIRNIITSTWKW